MGLARRGGGIERYGVSREDQDRFAAGSHQKAAAAIDACWFKDEILPVEIPQRRGDPLRLEYDEGVRPGQHGRISRPPAAGVQAGRRAR